MYSEDGRTSTTDNEKHTKCRHCEQAKEEQCRTLNRGIQRRKVKPLFHLRSLLNQTETNQDLKNMPARTYMNIDDEIQKMERMRARFLEECRNADIIREKIRRFYTKLDAQTSKVEELMRQRDSNDDRYIFEEME